MKAVPLSYILRNLWVRRVTTVLTAGGMGLVVFVFATVLMMSEGIRETMVATGQTDNVVVLRKGAGTEVNSSITRQQASVLESLQGLATDGLGREMLSKEPSVLINLPKRNGGESSNATVRGTSHAGMALRPQVRIVAGRMFREGTSEIVAGQAIARSFAHVAVGDTLRFAGRDWTVVGLLDGNRSAFDSEIWADAEQVLQAFRRPSYSSVIFRLADPQAFAKIREQIATDPRLGLEAKTERQFYAEQTESLTHFITLLGLSLSVVFSIGAIVGAMITMFAAVAQRVGEIGTLRALGFRAGAVMVAFLGESLGFALVGGAFGVLAASLLQNVNISTVNYRTMSEIAFHFKLTPTIIMQTMSFSLFMGFVGGFIPAWLASRMKIVDCLRAA